MPRIESWNLVPLTIWWWQMKNNKLQIMLLMRFVCCLPLYSFFFPFQTFTFLLAWHFPHRYLLNVSIKRENNSKSVWNLSCHGLPCIISVWKSFSSCSNFGTVKSSCVNSKTHNLSQAKWKTYQYQFKNNCKWLIDVYYMTEKKITSLWLAESRPIYR